MSGTDPLAGLPELALNAYPDQTPPPSLPTDSDGLPNLSFNLDTGSLPSIPDVGSLDFDTVDSTRLSFPSAPSGSEYSFPGFDVSSRRLDPNNLPTHDLKPVGGSPVEKEGGSIKWIEKMFPEDSGEKELAYAMREEGATTFKIGEFFKDRSAMRLNPTEQNQKTFWEKWGMTFLSAAGIWMAKREFDLAGKQFDENNKIVKDKLQQEREERQLDREFQIALANEQFSHENALQDQRLNQGGPGINRRAPNAFA